MCILVTVLLGGSICVTVKITKAELLCSPTMNYGNKEFKYLHSTPYWQDCGMACYLDQNCKFWTFLPNNKFCYFNYSHKGFYRHEGFLSGSENCYRGF